jgi:cytochrome c1
MSTAGAARHALPRAGLAALVAATLLAGCRGSGATRPYGVASGGYARSGRDAILSRHCGACHDIPGVVGAHGVVGPPLDSFARRTFVAGLLPNTPPNLVRWLREPQRIDPLSAMPTLGLDEQEARNVAAYLYSLEMRSR